MKIISFNRKFFTAVTVIVIAILMIDVRNTLPFSLAVELGNQDDAGGFSEFCRDFSGDVYNKCLEESTQCLKIKERDKDGVKSNKCVEESTACWIECPDVITGATIAEATACREACDVALELCHNLDVDNEYNICLAEVKTRLSEIQQENDYSSRESTDKTLPPQSPSNINQPNGSYAEALVEFAPTDDDLKIPPPSEEDKKKPYSARVGKIDGFADMQLLDGTWVSLEEGNIVPEGAKVYTGYNSTIELYFSNHLFVMLRSLSELDMEVFEATPEFYRTELKLESGELRFKAQESTIKTDMKVSTPNATASPYGTDWGIAYNKDTGASIFEVYDRSVGITNLKTGEEKTITSSYGSGISRIEIALGGEMVEKIAIPKSEWSAFQNSQKEINQLQTKSNSQWYFVVVKIFIICAIGYVIYRWRAQLLSLGKRIINKNNQLKP